CSAAELPNFGGVPDAVAAASDPGRAALSNGIRSPPVFATQRVTTIRHPGDRATLVGVRSGGTMPTSASDRNRTPFVANEGPHPWRRFVAVGDSFTEGVGDPDPSAPNGLRGWA